MELESKFIEGTNNQYSIRNDGVVIKHWHLDRNRNKFYQDRVCSKCKGNNEDYFTDLITSEGKCIKRSVKGLVASYFNLHNPFTCKDSYLKICFKDSNKSNCSLSNLYYTCKDHNKHNVFITEEERQKTANQKRELFLVSEKQKENRKVTNIKHVKKKVEEITPNYVANLLSLYPSQLTPELYIAGKTRILIKRKIKQIQNGTN